jgi:hypothetical protein
MTKEERARLWVTVYGMSAFQKAETTCQQLLDLCPDNRHALFSPLAMAVHIHYARPFCRIQGVPRSALFKKEDVPTELQGMHEFLVAIRDKMVAHTDADTAKAFEIVLHDVQFERAAKDLYISCCDPTIQRDAYEQSIRVIHEMKVRAMRRFAEMKPILAASLPQDFGKYILNLEGDAAFARL